MVPRNGRSHLPHSRHRRRRPVLDAHRGVNIHLHRPPQRSRQRRPRIAVPFFIPGASSTPSRAPLRYTDRVHCPRFSSSPTVSPTWISPSCGLEGSLPSQMLGPLPAWTRIALPSRRPPRRSFDRDLHRRDLGFLNLNHAPPPVGVTTSCGQTRPEDPELQHCPSANPNSRPDSRICPSANPASMHHHK
jgi:hypothetical protein